MTRPQLAIEEEIHDALKNLPLWIRKGNFIIREFVLKNFASAIGLINAVAVLSESADHHPDILIYGWNKVRITLTTHNLGGLTELDFNLAKKIEELGY